MPVSKLTKCRFENRRAYIMELKDRVVIMSERNVNDLNELYREINLGMIGRNELERIVNKYITSAIEEIREDLDSGR